MDISAQCLSHFPTTNVRDRVEGQAVEELIVIQKVLANAVDHQMQEFVFFVEEQGDSQIANLLFGVLVGGDKVDGFEMPEINVPAKNVYVQ